MAPDDRSGATLVARIDYIYLSPTSGGTGKRGGFQDTMEGALILRGPRGGVAAETPLRAIMPLFSDVGRRDPGRGGLSRTSRGARACVRRMGAKGAGALTARNVQYRVAWKLAVFAPEPLDTAMQLGCHAKSS